MSNHLKPWQLLKPEPNACQECATVHDPDLPHDQTSMFYQYKFYNEHGRWPTWYDAMAHCTEDMRLQWAEGLLYQFKKAYPDVTEEIKKLNQMLERFQAGDFKVPEGENKGSETEPKDTDIT